MTEISLTTEDLELVIHPEHGGDLHSLTGRPSGVDVLFKPGWPPSGQSALGGTRTEWVADYRGGWQVLLPNAGDECERDGQTWGFHGEASTVPWTVEQAESTSATLSVRLRTAPLHLQRRVTVVDATVRIDEIVTNTGSTDAEVMYVHHPAFGHPLIDGGARLDTGARSIISDPLMPGSIAEPGSSGAWPHLPTSNGPLDLRQIPDRDNPRAFFGYLTDFDEPFYAITNPSIQLGVAVRWTPDPFRHAWLWQEMYHTTDEPWGGQACAMAVEPASTFPGLGLNVVNQRGERGLTIPGGAHVTTAIEMTVFSPPADFVGVTAVAWGGHISFAE
jgi:galactose mutarotase-like enzyme